MSILLKKVNPEELTYESAICWGFCSDYTYNELAEEGTQRALSILINITNYHLDLLRRKSGDNQEAKENHKCALSALQLMRMSVSTLNLWFLRSWSVQLWGRGWGRGWRDLTGRSCKM